MSRSVVLLLIVALVMLASFPASAKPLKIRLSDGSRISTYLYKPTGKGPYPAVIVLPVWGGMNQYSKNWSAALAKKRYVTLTVNYETGGGWPDIKVGETYDYLKSLPEVDPKRIGLAGFSFGGQRALEIVYEWANGYPPRPVRAMIVYYPGNISFPYADAPPILFLHGELDDLTPWQEIVDYCEETRKEGRLCKYKIYKKATHGFTHRTKRIKRIHNPSAERDAFNRSVEFLNKYLRGAPIE